MLRIGAVAYAPYVVTIFEGLKRHFHREGVELDWVLYSNYDALVTAFVTGEVDLAWNGPLAYVKIRRALAEPCRVVAMRDIDVGLRHNLSRCGSRPSSTLPICVGGVLPLGVAVPCRPGSWPIITSKRPGSYRIGTWYTPFMKSGRQPTAGMRPWWLTWWPQGSMTRAPSVGTPSPSCVPGGVSRMIVCGSSGRVRAIATAASRRRAASMTRWRRKSPPLFSPCAMMIQNIARCLNSNTAKPSYPAPPKVLTLWRRQPRLKV